MPSDKTQTNQSDTNPIATAYGFLTTNLLILPGLGSWMAGHRLRGAVQIIIATIGLLVTLAGIVPVFMEFDPNNLTLFHLAFWAYLPTILTGFATFMFAWFWALGTSLRLISKAKTQTHPKRQ